MAKAKQEPKLPKMSADDLEDILRDEANELAEMKLRLILFERRLEIDKEECSSMMMSLLDELRASNIKTEFGSMFMVSRTSTKLNEDKLAGLIARRFQITKKDVFQAIEDAKETVSLKPYVSFRANEKALLKMEKDKYR